MKWIEDLRDAYRGEEIFILGTDPDLRRFPDDFLKDKIAIALNWAFICFPKCKFILFWHTKIAKAITIFYPDLLYKCIIPYPFANMEMDMNGKILMSEGGLAEYLDRPFFMRRPAGLTTKEQVKYIARAIAYKQPCNYMCLGTVSHAAIEAAAVLGAKKITLIGCSAGWENGEPHAQTRGLWFFEHPPKVATEKSEAETLELWKQGTRWFARAFAPYGIEVCRYRFKTGYEPIEKEEN